jgi:microcystin-dependent protein
MISRDNFPTGDFEIVETVYAVFAIPNSDWVQRILLGALLLTAWEENWVQRGTTTPYTASGIFSGILDSFELRDSIGGEVNIGTVYSTAYASAQPNELACNGGIHARDDYPELYAVLDAEFIIDADNFRVPDLRGRIAGGIGQGMGTSNRTMGELAGQEAVTLSEGQLPAHNHKLTPYGSGESLVSAPKPSPPPGSNYFPNLAMATTANGAYAVWLGQVTGASGENLEHENMQPTVFLNWMIRAKP